MWSGRLRERLQDTWPPRGPVIGPLIIAGVLIEDTKIDQLRELGVRDSKVLSQLKLRLGWGKTGQQDIMDNWYPYLPVYTLSELFLKNHRTDSISLRCLPVQTYQSRRYKKIHA